MYLSTSTWQEVERYLERSTGILIPIGSHEQHGPNGFVGTDALCPEIVARGVAEKLDVLVGPTQSIGMAQHHLGFPGSITLRPSTLVAVIRDTVQSLAIHGFTHIYFLNGHGGNINTVNAAFAEVHSEISLGHWPEKYSGLAMKMGNWFAGRRVRELGQKLYGEADGSHATASEVSLTYYGYPEHVKNVKMTPTIAPEGPIRDATDFRTRHPDGRMGSDPTLANPQDGKRLFEASVEDVVEEYRGFTRNDKATKRQ